MNNPKLELLDVFPVHTREPSQRDLALAKHSGKPEPKSVKFDNHITLLDACIHEEGNGAANSAIEHALRASKIYKTWQKSMPFLKEAPNIHGFRNIKRHKNDVKEVNREILEIGGYLPLGQILYRGGDFKNDNIVVSNGPISTSVLPSVARWHAIEVGGEIAVLRISENHAIRAFAFRSRGNQGFKQEHEVLIQNNIELKQTNTRNYLGIQIVEYDVFSKNL